VRDCWHSRVGRPAGPIVQALKRLEYRGYDSAGVVTLENGRIERRCAASRCKSTWSRATRTCCILAWEGPPLALEGALKLKELSYIHTLGVSAVLTPSSNSLARERSSEV
jgi:glucosamine 6-phosphate synthetase-like amidotransferase/phosphosugar isomerase protein